MKTPTTLLDILSFIAAARNVLGNDHASSTLIAPAYCQQSISSHDNIQRNQTCIPIPGQLRQRQSHQGAPQRVTSPDTTDTDSDDHADSSSSSDFRIGDMIELYGDTSYFAIPAIVTGRSVEPSSTQYKYNLQNTITNSRPTGVDPEFIHPYQVYQDGTRASCNIGALRKMYMIPCTIISHSIKKPHQVSYQVSYIHEEHDDEVVEAHLPFSRVQRYHQGRIA